MLSMLDVAIQDEAARLSKLDKASRMRPRGRLGLSRKPVNAGDNTEPQ